MRKNKVHNASAEDVGGAANKESKEREENAAEVIQGQRACSPNYAFGGQFNNLFKFQPAFFALGS